MTSSKIAQFVRYLSVIGIAVLLVLLFTETSLSLRLMGILLLVSFLGFISVKRYSLSNNEPGTTIWGANNKLLFLLPKQGNYFFFWQTLSYFQSVGTFDTRERIELNKFQFLRVWCIDDNLLSLAQFLVRREIYDYQDWLRIRVQHSQGTHNIHVLPIECVETIKKNLNELYGKTYFSVNIENEDYEINKRLGELELATIISESTWKLSLPIPVKGKESAAQIVQIAGEDALEYVLLLRCVDIHKLNNLYVTPSQFFNWLGSQSGTLEVAFVATKNLSPNETSQTAYIRLFDLVTKHMSISS